MKNLSGIILSGGKSNRMGTDKAFIRFHDQFLIEYPINLLKPRCNEIIISANSEEYKRFGFDVVYDEYPNCGPMGGIFSTLNHSKNDWNIALSCDTPYINNELLTLLINETGDYDCIVPQHDGHLEPLIALYHKNCLPKFLKFINEGLFSLQSNLKKLNCYYLDVTELGKANPMLFSNFNSPADIK